MDVAFPSKLGFLAEHGYGFYFILPEGVTRVPEEFSSCNVIDRRGRRYIEVTEEVYVSPGPWVNTFVRDGVELRKAQLPRAFFFVDVKKKESPS